MLWTILILPKLKHVKSDTMKAPSRTDTLKDSQMKYQLSINV